MKIEKNTGLKQCSKCKHKLTIDNFNKMKKQSDGLDTRCKKCSQLAKKISNKNIKAKNPDEWANRRRKYVKTYKIKDITRYKNMERKTHIKQKYGMSVEHYNTKLKSQNNVCYICKTHNNSKKLIIDHCHATGIVRGVLCHFCNSVLGFSKENIDVLKSVISYIEEWNRKSKNTIILGIHGAPRSGKDSICNYILSKLPLLRYGPSVQVKRATAAMFDIPEEYLYDDTMKDRHNEFWDMSYRKMAQLVGNESSRKIFGDDFWMRHVEKYLQDELPADKQGIILADIRYQNEAKWVKMRKGILIFVTRKNKPTASNESHEAERGLDPKLADIIIENDGTLDELYEKVQKVLDSKF